MFYGGVFHSTQHSRNFQWRLRCFPLNKDSGTGANDTEIFFKGFQKIRKLLNSEVRTIQWKIPEGGKSMEQKSSAKNFRKFGCILEIVMMIYLLLENNQNSKRYCSNGKRSRPGKRISILPTRNLDRIATIPCCVMIQISASKITFVVLTYPGIIALFTFTQGL